MPDDPVVLVPQESSDARSAVVESPQGADGPRTRWWLVAAAAIAILIAAVAISSQYGSDTASDGAEAASDASDLDAEAPVDEAEVPQAPPANSAPTDQTDPDPAGDESTDDEDDQSAELSQAFGEPEHPVSGVEPYIPSRVRPVELGPPAEVCSGPLMANRIQLPLRFASTKPDRIDQLTWSPDCRRIVFRVGSTLWLADGDGTGDMPFLTAQHGLSAPVWSPDSQWIAFSQGAIVEGERASHIFMVLPDGLGLAQLTHGAVLDRDPSWSPGESRIAFARRARVTDADGGTQFVHRIVVVDLMSGDEQEVASSAERMLAPSWSPDGGAIAYRVGDELRALRLDDPSRSTLLVGVVGGPGSWSPDGSRVAAFRDWIDGGATILVSDLPGLSPGDLQVISVRGVEQASLSMVPALQWSADGQRLIFSDSASPTSHWAYSIAVPPPAPPAEQKAAADVVEAVYDVVYAAYERVLDGGTGRASRCSCRR